MALVWADRVKDTTTTTGTGAVTVSGTAPPSFRTFAAVCSTSDTFYYCIEDPTNNAWETGLGTYSAANQITRTTVIASSNGGAAVNFGAGTKTIFIVPLATHFPTFGRTEIWVPAAAMVARTTNGAASGSAEMTTNDNMVVTLDFDASTQEFAQFSIAMPKSWDRGTVTFVPYWSHPSTATNFGVVWQLAGVAVSNDDALDVAYGTAQTSTDTGGTTNDLYVGPESAAITIAGTPAEADLVGFQVARVPANGSDTMAVDARLHGVKLIINTSAPTDL